MGVKVGLLHQVLDADDAVRGVVRPHVLEHPRQVAEGIYGFRSFEYMTLKLQPEYNSLIVNFLIDMIDRRMVSYLL